MEYFIILVAILQRFHLRLPTNKSKPITEECERWESQISKFQRTILAVHCSALIFPLHQGLVSFWFHQCTTCVLLRDSVVNNPSRSMKRLCGASHKLIMLSVVLYLSLSTRKICFLLCYYNCFLSHFNCISVTCGEDQLIFMSSRRIPLTCFYCMTLALPALFNNLILTLHKGEQEMS